MLVIKELSHATPIIICIFAIRTMKINYWFIHLFAIFLSIISQTASAQGWKPLCVDGGNTAGNNSGTWQKINSSSEGGGTWKKLGDCIIPDPPINGGRPYTHIIDTGPSMGNNHCNSAGGFIGDGDSWYTKWEPWLPKGKLTPNTIDGVAVMLFDDNCGQGLSIAFDSRFLFKPKRQHFKSLTIYDSPLTTTWVWGKAMDWLTFYRCDSPGGEWGPPPTECSTQVVWGPRGVPVRMQPYSRYYINVIY